MDKNATVFYKSDVQEDSSVIVHTIKWHDSNGNLKKRESKYEIHLNPEDIKKVSNAYADVYNKTLEFAE